MMNTLKKMERVVAPPTPHFVGDGFRVHGFIPGMPGLDMRRMDPFLVLDYNAPFYFSPSDKVRGVGVHPHKGFETVTIAYQGSIAHNDSYGGGGVIGQGDVQWMTASSGLLHKEFHEEEFSKKGGTFQMVQLWVNLPAKDKSTAPKYQAIGKERIAKYILEDGAGSIDVIAGNYKDTFGPASTFTPVHMMNANILKNKKATFSFPENYTTFAIIIEGSVKINGEHVDTNHFVLFENAGEQFDILAEDNAKVLVVSGEPIGEPIAAHGPFVMNTREELIEAFEDFNKGKFGELE